MGVFLSLLATAFYRALAIFYVITGTAGERNWPAWRIMVKMTPRNLRLEPVTQDNVRAACKLKLRADQEDLVAPVAWSLADAYTMPDVAWPRLIYDHEQLVGFVMAAFAAHHENPIFHSHLWRLNIAAGHQGKGYGRFAVEEVCQEAVRRGHHRLTVGYHEGEHGPEEFYRRLGFRPTGEYNHGEAVAERTIEPALE